MGENKGWCPWWKEVCDEGLTETMLKKTKRGQVPIKCRMWKKVTGNDPQSGASIDKYDCSVGWMTTLQLEQARVNFSLGGAVESLRNRINDLGQNIGTFVKAIPLISTRDGIVNVEHEKRGEIEHKEGKD